VLKSDKDLDVTATITENAIVAVDGSVTTENAPPGKSAAAAVAVARGVYDNNVQALIEGGATVDARGTLTVSSELRYPSLLSNLPFHPDRFDPNDSNADNSISDELSTMLNRTGGLNRALNVWAAASG